MSIDKEIDRIFELVDNLCWECHEKKDWRELDQLLMDVDVKNTKVVHLLSWLTITGCVKSKLPFREMFFELVREKIIREEKYSEDYIDNKLLIGLN